jgi:hypothetical protein
MEIFPGCYLVEMWLEAKKCLDGMRSWKARKEEDYLRKGNSFILLGELRQLRNDHMAANDMESLQTYVMLHLGVKLFLRAEEMLTLQEEVNFDPQQQFSVIHPDCIGSLAVRVQGKGDKNWASVCIPWR